MSFLLPRIPSMNLYDLELPGTIRVFFGLSHFAVSGDSDSAAYRSCVLQYASLGELSDVYLIIRLRFGF